MKHTRGDYSVVQDLTVAVEFARLFLDPTTKNKQAIARRLAYEILGLDSCGRRTDDPIAEDQHDERIPWNEPVFLIRAQDINSGSAVREWCRLAKEKGASEAIVKIAEDVASQMDLWPVKKVPDVPDDVRKLWMIEHLLTYSPEALRGFSRASQL